MKRDRLEWPVIVVGIGKAWDHRDLTMTRPTRRPNFDWWSSYRFWLRFIDAALPHRSLYSQSGVESQVALKCSVDVISASSIVNGGFTIVDECEWCLWHVLRLVSMGWDDKGMSTTFYPPVGIHLRLYYISQRPMRPFRPNETVRSDGWAWRLLTTNFRL
jgi:hypothetical protein